MTFIREALGPSPKDRESMGEGASVAYRGVTTRKEFTTGLTNGSRGVS